MTIEVGTRTPNGQGGYTIVWAPVATAPNVRAEIIGLSGDEALKAGIERNVQQWRVTIRRREDVTAKHRLKEGSVVYDIKSVMPDPRSEAATLLICETGAPAAGG
ncbi:MAG TPA: phage head closure protein [Allosphingosinicella sp.]|nr:phage head closure protein [Allosphingosinicella sp.]